MEHLKTLKRLFDVGTTLTGLGMRVGAQEYLGLDIDEAAYAQKLRHYSLTHLQWEKVL